MKELSIYHATSAACHVVVQKESGSLPAENALFGGVISEDYKITYDKNTPPDSLNPPSPRLGRTGRNEKISPQSEREKSQILSTKTGAESKARALVM